MRPSQIFSEQIWKVRVMPKCPFCGKEINSVCKLITEHLSLDVRSEPAKVVSDELDILYTCPECGGEFNFLLDEKDIRDFLEDRYIILHSDDPEIKRRGDYVLYKSKIYKIIGEEGATGLLHLELVEDELVVDILKADIE